MTHIWVVKRGSEPLGTVEAVSRKGACHAAYEKFGIDHLKRSTISVEKAAIGGIVSGPPPSLFGESLGEVVCSFNPALAEPYRDKTLDDCRQRFETGPFTGFPRHPE